MTPRAAAFEYLEESLAGKLTVQFNYLNDSVVFSKPAQILRVRVRSVPMREIEIMNRYELDLLVYDLLLSSCFEVN